MNKTRIGVFSIAAPLLFGEDPCIPMVFAACRITKCAYDQQTNTFVYSAMSNFFDELTVLEMGMRQIPIYDWMVSIEEPLGMRVVKAERRPAQTHKGIMRI